MQNTTNLSLNKPELTDTVSVTVPALATNFQTLDDNIGNPTTLTTTSKVVVDAINEHDQQIGNLSRLQVTIDSFPVIAPEADDTARIKRAISSLYTTGGKIKFPVGTYNFTSINNLREGIELEGVSKEKTIFNCTGNTTAFSMDSTQTSAYHMAIRNLMIQGTAGVGIDMKGFAYADLENLIVTGFDYNIKMYGFCYYNTLSKVRLDNAKQIGLYLYVGTDGNQPNANSFIKVTFISNKTGLQIDNGQGNQFTHCSFEVYDSTTDSSKIYTDQVIIGGFYNMFMFNYVEVHQGNAINYKNSGNMIGFNEVSSSTGQKYYGTGEQIIIQPDMVRLPMDSDLGFQNLIDNSNMEAWTAASGSPPVAWTQSGSGYCYQESTTVKNGKYSARFKNFASSSFALQQDLTSLINLSDIQGKDIFLVAWINAPAVGVMQLELVFDTGFTQVTTANNQTANQWEKVIIHAQVPTNASALKVYIQVSGSVENICYLDSVLVRKGGLSGPYEDKPLVQSGGKMYGNIDMNGNYLAVGSIAALPTASATYRGMIAYVQGNGTTTADTFYMCLMSATGTYSWKQIIAG